MCTCVSCASRAHTPFAPDVPSYGNFPRVATSATDSTPMYVAGVVGAALRFCQALEGPTAFDIVVQGGNHANPDGHGGINFDMISRALLSYIPPHMPSAVLYLMRTVEQPYVLIRFVLRLDAA